MTEFPKFNPHKACPVCHSKTANAAAVLVAIPNTEEGGLSLAVQVHKECYNLVVKMEGTILVESANDKK